MPASSSVNDVLAGSPYHEKGGHKQTPLENKGLTMGGFDRCLLLSYR